MKRPKILVVLGPTASGKSDLAVKLAEKFNGEIISADSRQVYTGLNIGSGKISKQGMRGVPHHMLDVVSPKKVLTVEEFKEKAFVAIDDIISRGKLPIICGGSGFYIQAVVDNTTFPDVPANPKLREKLEELSAEKLIEKLEKLDPRRAKEIDPNNKRRVIRAIEIASALGKVPESKNEPKYTPFMVGIKTSPDILREKIHIRLLYRMKKGMVDEAKKLRQSGLSLKRMENLGLEYRYLARHISGKLSKEEMLVELENEIWKFARRQMTWFKRDKRIKWFDIKKTKTTAIEKTVKKFVGKVK
jgi:tRNA dimethylallyltransferase